MANAQGPTIVHPKEIRAEKLNQEHLTSGGCLVIVEDAGTLFPIEYPATAVKRAEQILDWTDWPAKLNSKAFQYGGLAVCFPNTGEYDGKSRSLERVTGEAFSFVALTRKYNMGIGVHNIANKTKIVGLDTHRVDPGGTSVYADFVFNRPDPVITYRQALNRVLYRRFGLLFKLRPDTFVLPSEAFDNGIILRDDSVRGSSIRQVYLLSIGSSYDVTARAYELRNADDPRIVRWQGRNNSA
jgi:hypothetical protein